jgi:leucyl-tRNA synthetase
MVKCPQCGWVPVPEEELPVLLPEVDSYEPTDTGESPLSKMRDWVECKCPRCGGAAERETDTMPQWAGSSWYFLRYTDPRCDTGIASKQALDYWGPVDWYNGGMEHTTLHLLYSRFWHKFLYDIGVVPTKEPYQKRTSHGMILGEGGVKMSKSRGNVVNPNDVVAKYGADTLRLYIMFIGDFEKAAAWSDNAVKGCKRFLDRIWALAENRLEGDDLSPENEAAVHRTIKKVSEDIEEMKFNTAIAAMMSLVNQFYDTKPSRGDMKKLLQLLSPFAPHFAEELWEIQGFEGYAMESAWPDYDESKTVESVKELAVQINGKLRSTITVAADADDDVVIAAAKQDTKVQKAMDGMELVRSIVVKNKLVNLILKPKK